MRAARTLSRSQSKLSGFRCVAKNAHNLSICSTELPRVQIVLLILVALICGSLPARGETPGIQFDEMMVGANGDSRVQFIELKMQSAADNAWGPQSGEATGRMMLVFYDATGAQTGKFVFPADAPVGIVDPINGGYSVLVATQGFAEVAGMPAPDFVIPKSVIPLDGKVCLTANPLNPNAPQINLCLSYGNFVADTGSDTIGQPAGAPTTAAPVMGASSLKRNNHFGNYGTGQFNADFTLASASPRNSDGVSGTITVASNVNQGRNLFMHETFGGNGRTCSTCHQPDIQFGLSPTKISFLQPSDPIFVAENDPVLNELENSCLLRGSRGLNLENIDGFENPPVFRGSPALVNLMFTAPFGRSGEFTSLRTFSTGAVVQHFPRSLLRNSDPLVGPLDFRLPTQAELIALEAFMLSLKLPSNGNFLLSQMTNAAIARGGDAGAIARGQDLFFGVSGSAKCFLCHSGPVLALAAPEIGGGNQSFNTGVSQLAINATFPEACLGGQPLPPEAGGNRTFSTPQLIGVARTAPYFHNNAVPALHDAVAFYAGPEFNTSPAAQNPLIGTISLSAQDINDIVAFLTALDEPFVDCDLDTVDDRVQIASGAADCNANHILDTCELAEKDCNANGILDECDLAPVTIESQSAFATSSGGFFLHAADIDGDGDVDLLIPEWIALDLAVLLNNGDGSSFTSAGTWAVSSYPRSVTTADFDGDGKLDVAVSNLLVNHVSIFINQGLDEEKQWLGLTPGTAVTMNAPPPANGGSLFVMAHDLNNDGFPDLAVCKSFMNQVSIVLNLGPDQMGAWQGFGTPVDIATNGLTPWSLAAGDLSGDGLPDLVAANQLSDSISVFKNLGGGTFSAAVNYPVQDSPESVTLADLTGDGLADVITANAESDTLTMLTATPGGTLVAPETLVVGSYPFGAQPHSVLAADADNDGDLDLLTSNKESSNVTILLNDGTGHFGTPANTPWVGAPDYAVFTDLNGDSRMDIAAVEYAASTVRIAMNSTPAFGNDCNNNGIPDSCDLAEQSSLDLNMNQILDSCEHLGDLNSDGAVNILDVDVLVNVLIGVDKNSMHVFRSDVNGDLARDGRDIQTFLSIITPAQ